MATRVLPLASFVRYGPDMPPGSVLLSVPHAGRDYPAALLANLRVPPDAVTSLEDRHVDAVALAARRSEIMLVQRAPRAWIDLNRAESERDSRVDEGASPVGASASAKLRSGLGLVPRRAASESGLWRRRWTAAEIGARIAADHRPYHDALAKLLAATRARFGVAVLLDLHSMPPLAHGSGPKLVLGDRWGGAADARFVGRLKAVAEAAGWPAARNAPYAGGHILERHGAPARGVHAIQLEIDRSLYLDPSLDAPDPVGVARVAALVRAMLDALMDEVMATPMLLAAE